jgi:hypothetical protein
VKSKIEPIKEAAVKTACEQFNAAINLLMVFGRIHFICDYQSSLTQSKAEFHSPAQIDALTHSFTHKIDYYNGHTRCVPYTKGVCGHAWNGPET